MTRAQLRARAERLWEPAVGLSREVPLWRDRETPVLTDKQRRRYLRGIQDANAGADAAHMALVKVEERLEREGGGRGDGTAAEKRLRGTVATGQRAARHTLFP